MFQKSQLIFFELKQNNKMFFSSSFQFCHGLTGLYFKRSLKNNVTLHQNLLQK